MGWARQAGRRQNVAMANAEPSFTANAAQAATTDQAICEAVRAAQLQAHSSSARQGVLASVAVLAVAAWMLLPTLDQASLRGWLSGLGLALGLRVALSMAHGRRWWAWSNAAWLQGYQASAGLLGLAWGTLALLVPGTVGAQDQVILVFLLSGLAAGGMVTTLFDLRAALAFALPMLLTLGWRALATPAPLPRFAVVAALMLGLLVVFFTTAARRLWRERRDLAAARLAEAQRAAELQRAESLMRRVFDHADEGISLYDEHWRLQAWNGRFADTVGLPQAQLYVGMPIEECLRLLATLGEFGHTNPAEDEVQNRLRQLQERSQSVTRRTRPNGRIIEIRRNATPDGGCVIVYVDITHRQASENALEDYRRTLGLLMDTSGQGCWFIDNALCTTDVNPAMCKMLGLPREALMGRSIYDFVDEANRAIFEQQVHQRAAGQPGSYEVALLHSSGRLVHCVNNASPLVDSQGRKVGAVGLFSDISAHKAAAEQISLTSRLLEQKSRVLATTLDSLDQGVMGVDAQGRINAWNQRLLTLLDLPPGLLEGGATLAEVGRYQLNQGHFGPQAERLEDQARHNLMAFLAGTALPREQRYQRVRVDGTVLDVHVLHASDGSHVRTFTDVTANVRAQQALRESESRFRRMADAAPALIWLSDQDGQATWFNQRWLHSVGQTMEQAVHEGWGSRLHPDDLSTCRDRFAEAFAHRQPYDIEFRVCRQDGAVQWVADTGIPRFALDGSFEGYISYGWDITGRKAAEVALIAAKTEAERANRAKSQFLSRMSHELRTPLNAILGFGQLLASDPQEPLLAVQRRRVQEIQRGGHHLLALINDVLDLSRIEAGALQLQAQAVDLAAVMGDCLRLVEPVARERGIALSLASPTEGATLVMADATRLRQVLLNLLGNAIKYNREGGMVALVCHAEPRHLLLEVSDCGPGLTEAQQQRLFQAFERLDADHSGVEGAGIGLALSKWLVELMHGEIGVRSQPGVGSTFWLRLQRAGDPATPLALPCPTTARQAPATDTGGSDATVHHVLYVEDNTVNQVLMEGMLAHRPGLRLQVADRPSVGLAMARAQRPDLVLLDIQLPEMDGVALLRVMRAMPSMAGVPMIAVSANAMPSDLQAAREAGFDDYLTKPLELGRLLAAVNRALDR